MNDSTNDHLNAFFPLFISVQPTTVFLSLGANIGDRTRNISLAIDAVSQRIGRVVAHSSNYETAPWGFDSKNQFINAVVEVETLLSATETLNILIDIEKKLGRKQKTLNHSYSDRTIDLDILFFGNEIVNTDSLQIPHPLIAQREFVLKPLCEIAPMLVHPTLQKTIQQLYNELKSV